MAAEQVVTSCRCNTQIVVDVGDEVRFSAQNHIQPLIGFVDLLFSWLSPTGG